MNNFISLLKVQLSAFFLNGKRGRTKTQNRNPSKRISVIVLIFCAIALYSWVYSKGISETLLPNGNLDQLLAIMLSLSALINFLFSFYSTGNVLYGGKEYEILSALPIKTVTIVLSKLAYMIVSNLFFAVAIMVPAFFVFYNAGGVITSGLVINYLIMTVFSTFLPIAVSIVIGTLVSVLSSFSRHKNIIQTIMYLLLFAGIFTISFISAEDESGMAFFSTIGKVYFLMDMVKKGQSDIVYALVFSAINICSFLVVFALTTVCYKKINSILSAKRTRKNFKLKEYSNGGQFKTLYKKEMRRLFSCPVYIINCLFGIVLLLVVVIVLCAIGSDAGGLLAVISAFVVPFMPCMFTFTFMMSPLTAPSPSLEGQSYWLLKVLPITSKKIINSKLAFHYTFYFPCALILSVVLNIFMKTPAVLFLLSVISILQIAVLSGTLGLFVGFKFPKLDWGTEQQAVKQGLAVFIMTICSFVLTAILGVSAYFVCFKWEIEVVYYMIGLNAFLLLINCVVAGILYKRRDYLINKN